MQATRELDDDRNNGMKPLVEAMMEECPAPMVRCVNDSNEFSMLVGDGVYSLSLSIYLLGYVYLFGVCPLSRSCILPRLIDD